MIRHVTVCALVSLCPSICYAGSLKQAAGQPESAAGYRAAPVNALARMPVKEITVFKDGHAFVVHEGKMPTDAAGNVNMDYLPDPILGTFWPFSSDPAVKLQAVTARRRRVRVERTALTLRELLEANPGASVGVTQTDGHAFGATIEGIPERSPRELEATSAPNSGDQLPQKSGIILLKTADGTAVVNVDSVRDATFRNTFRHTVAEEEFRNLLTLKLQWSHGKPEREANVGMMYVQSGVRWVPSYKVTIDGKGSAHVQLQATLVNDLTDLNDANVNLVIGVPSFAFEDTPDPIALQEAIAAVTSRMDGAPMGQMLSNAVMTQVGGFGGGGAMGVRGPQGPGAGEGSGSPEVTRTAKNEDLFVFSVKHVTLARGERMVMPVAEYTFAYKDLYTVDVPFVAPAVLRQNVNSSVPGVLDQISSQPRALHVIRLLNRGTQPLTTAPALVMADGRVLAQGMMTYTGVGGACDLSVTTDPDLLIKRNEVEKHRMPDAQVWSGGHYARIDLAGTLTITNYGAKTKTVEVTHDLYGAFDSVDSGGTAEAKNLLAGDQRSDQPAYPYWWSWYNWPNWWVNLNGLSHASWTVTVPRGKTVTLGYKWHYFAP